MYKCKKCETEFDSKFCPNCGEAATEDEVMSGPEYEASNLERRIREKGIPNIWRRDSLSSKRIFGIAIAVHLAILVALIIFIVKFFDKFNYYLKLDRAEVLLVLEKYKSDIEKLGIAVIVFWAVNIVLLEFHSCFLRLSKIKWIKAKNVNAARIITAGVIADKDGYIDRDKFVETKAILYDANRDGVVKQMVICSLISIALYLTTNIIAFNLFIKWVTTPSQTQVGQFLINAMSNQEIFVPLIALIAAPNVVMFFVKKFLKKKEAEIDEWAKHQMKEQSKAIETANS